MLASGRWIMAFGINIVNAATHRLRATRLLASAASSSNDAQSSRSYPSAARLGIGVVVLRNAADPEVLVVRRAKEPAKGLWSFPGGGLELGENIAACAAREVREETGVEISNEAAPHESAWCNDLRFPMPFGAVESIVRDAAGAVQFHYVIVGVAAKPRAVDAVPHAGDDVDRASWVKLSQLHTLDTTKDCDKLAAEAARRFLMQPKDGLASTV